MFVEYLENEAINMPSDTTTFPYLDTPAFDVQVTVHRDKFL